MPRDPRYDILFEPIKIGPVTAPNRFYQVPHCSGMGQRMPQSLAAMRAMKAEGGWGVVNTEYCSIHPSSDDGGYPYASLWDEADVRAQARMVEAVHNHGALAGAELWHGGSYVSNLGSRLPTIGTESRPSDGSRGNPVQSRAMDKQDIAALRGWHKAAAKRALAAGFDIVYVYGAHGYLVSEFLSPTLNRRSDAYGGSLENRLRLLRELIEETKEAVGDRAAVAVRYALSSEDAQEGFARLAELPDLWDLTVDDYGIEMGGSRFVREAALEETLAVAKTITTKPVVAVGRFTSPDTMVRQIKRGVLDMIGAARPSIADPFLPAKIRDGRPEDIRECIGCNICYAHNSLGVPNRCTQNPTMGEEWRRGWHPETIATKASEDPVLIVGGGPAGLEAARALGQRGHSVTLAEADTALGGRVTLESALPGLAEWARVRDWRIGQLQQMANVEIYLDSALTAEQIVDFGFPHVALATGARWRRDGIGRWRETPFDGWEHDRVVSPDELMAGRAPEGSVLLYDDDHYYMGPVLALHLRALGRPVTLVTAKGRAGTWSGVTNELEATNRALIEAGVELITNHALEAFDGTAAHLSCVFTDRTIERPADAVVPITARRPRDDLYHDLMRNPDNGLKSVTRIGDCEAPGLIASAVYSGHRYAQELGPAGPVPQAARREQILLEENPA
ncbi:MAG: FAD-dependent oxidoreductase [Pseudomonadota bacterium]